MLVMVLNEVESEALHTLQVGGSRISRQFLFVTWSLMMLSCFKIISFRDPPTSLSYSRGIG